MPVYVDTPRWNRYHGLSGHLIADTEHELDTFGEALGLSKKDRSSGAAIPHFLLAAGRRDAAMAMGAVPLDAVARARKIEEIAAGDRRKPEAPARTSFRPRPESRPNRTDKPIMQTDLFRAAG